jgi:peptide/nickel transport system ATP-binding protein
MTGAPLLEVTDLLIRYRAGLFAPRPKPAVNGASFRLERGTTLGIVGESGSGKTSLLRAILRLLPVESGAIRLEGRDWLALRGRALRRARQGIGVVSQNPFLSLSPRLTVAEILAEPMLAAGRRPGPEMRDRIAALLSDCGLPAAFLDRRARELSGGQAQRVAIARALALHPEILLLDEVTSALDPELVNEVLDTIRGLAQGGMTMLIVSHEMGFVREVADTVVFMDAGEVIERGPPATLFSAPQTARARDFFGKVLRH